MNNGFETASSHENSRYLSPNSWQALIGPRRSALRRWKYFLTGVLFPAVCLGPGLFGFGYLLDRPWQSGKAVDYVVLLLRSPCLLLFLPLILGSMLCLTSWLLVPRLASQRIVRLGVYSGVILAFQFLILLMFSTGPISPLTTCVFGPIFCLLAFVTAWAIGKVPRFTIRHLMGLTTLVAVLVVLLRETDAEAFAGPPLLLVWICGPTLNVVTYVRAAIEITGDSRTSLAETRPKNKVNRGLFADIAAWIAWLATWGASWKIAIDQMLIEYSKLPLQNPNCYASSAAAHGHPRLVGTQAPERNDNRLVNRQMQRLKFLELALRAAHPESHRKIRGAYDRFGPRLANACQSNVWFADTSYLALKPLEWLAILIQWTTNVPATRIDGIYQK